jgi:hypothetical protein
MDKQATTLNLLLNRAAVAVDLAEDIENATERKAMLGKASRSLNDAMVLADDIMVLIKSIRGMML